MSARRFTGKYADDGKSQRLRVRAESGHRCVRCGHPFESGKYGKGEWSPCDSQCTHGGPMRKFVGGATMEYLDPKGKPAGEYVKAGIYVDAQWRVLTVHHLDGQKDNDQWWNTLALCQRCHLQIQTRVDPRIPWFLEHSEWFKPYAAGFYAWKYKGLKLTREETMARLDELLAHEFKTA